MGGIHRAGCLRAGVNLYVPRCDPRDGAIINLRMLHSERSAPLAAISPLANPIRGPLSSMANNTRCDERGRLLKNWSTAVNAYSVAVQDLSRTMGRLSYRQYQTLKAATEDARRISEDARVALETHRREHAC